MLKDNWGVCGLKEDTPSYTFRMPHTILNLLGALRHSEWHVSEMYQHTHSAWFAGIGAQVVAAAFVMEAVVEAISRWTWWTYLITTSDTSATKQNPY